MPFIDFSELQNALTVLKNSTDSLSVILKHLSTTTNNQEKINTQLYRAEQQLLLPDGLPRRAWYKHSLYAPGFYTGYGVKTLPAIREAIEQRNWKEAQNEIYSTAEAIKRFAHYLKQIN